MQKLNQVKKILTLEELEQKDIVTVEELLNSNIPPPEWLVEGLIPEKGLTILGGRWGEGKSLVSMYLACCCATGNNFLNKTTKKCRVLYIDEENDDVELKRRLEKLRNSNTLDSNGEKDIGLTIFKNIKICKDNKKKIKALLEEFKPDLVIVDSLARVMVGEENSAKDMKEIFDTLKGFSKYNHTSWFVLHHVRKNGTKKVYMDDLRGSGDISAAASSVLLINVRGQNEFELSHEKCRGAPNKAKQILFSVNDEKYNGKWGMVFSYLGEFSRSNLTAAESAAGDIKKIISEEKVKEFRSGYFKKKLEDKHGASAIVNGLKFLERKGLLLSVNRRSGRWKVKVGAINPTSPLDNTSIN